VNVSNAIDNPWSQQVRACVNEINISTFKFPTHSSISLSLLLFCFNIKWSQLGHYRLKFVSIFQLYFWRFTYSLRTLLLLRICLESTNMIQAFSSNKARLLYLSSNKNIILLKHNCKILFLFLQLLFHDWNKDLSK